MNEGLEELKSAVSGTKPAQQAAKKKSYAPPKKQAKAVASTELKPLSVDVPIPVLPVEEVKVVTPKGTIISDSKVPAQSPSVDFVHFYSTHNNFIAYFDVPVLDANGQMMRDARGRVVGDEKLVKFVSRHYATKDPKMIELLKSHHSYGGDGELPTANASKLFWMNALPKEAKMEADRRLKFLTADPNEYESDETYAG